MVKRKVNKKYKNTSSGFRIKEDPEESSAIDPLNEEQICVPPVSENSSSFLTMEEDMVPNGENADFHIKSETENSSEIYLEDYRIQSISVNYNNVDDNLENPPKRKRMTYVKKKTVRERNKYKVRGGGCYKCEYCGKQFSYLYTLERHGNLHIEKQSFQCEYCPRVFFLECILNEHLKVHRKAIELGKSVPIAQYYQKYLYSQEALPTVNVCKLCDEKFTTISLLRRHLKGHSNENSFKDEEIGKLQKLLKLDSKSLDEFKVMVQLKISQSDFSQYYEIVNRFSLELPLSDSDIDGTDEGLPQTKYKCELCNQEYLYDYEINEHTLQEHSACKKPYKCDICELEFVCYKMFFIHEQSQCRNENKKYKCEYCPARFMWLSNLENHKPLCRTNISEALNLWRKSKVKSADKDSELSSSMIDQIQKSLTFKCLVCKRIFKTMIYLQNHLKTHNCNAVEKSNITSKSNELLTFEDSTQLHLAIPEDMCKPHGRKTMKCKLCNSEHEKSRDLKAHLLSHQFNITSDGIARGFLNICRQCYPEERKSIKKSNKAALISRIKNEISNNQLERFYSISNEFGYELGISSSETDTEPEDDDEDSEKYMCELCGSCFNRKYKAFHHQNTDHQNEARPHSCTKCDWKFINRKLLEWHLRKQCEKTKKRFLCEKCNVRFMWKDNFEHHMQVSHNENSVKVTTSINCPLCPCDYKIEKRLETHIKMHGIDIKDLLLAKVLFQATTHPNGRKIIICKNCGTQFETIAGLRQHFKDTSTCGKNSGNTINYSITNEHGFELDINDSDSEGDEKGKDAGTNKTMQYTCVLCSISFRRKFEIARHQHSTHKYELLPLKCNKCIFKTMSLNILDYHKRTQCDNHKKLHQCDECNFKFMWLENLEKHKELLHGKAESPEVEKVFECELCPIKYNSKDLLAAHKDEMHPPKMPEISPKPKECPIEIPPDEQQQQPQNQKWMCPICGRLQPSAFVLTIHIRRHTGEKPYKCDLCDKAYPNQTELRRHKKRHNEKPITCPTCPTCNKTFANVRNLGKHQVVHSGEKPHKCTYGDCKRSFRFRQNLVEHMRLHTGEKPYVCGICGEKFIRNSELKTHRAKKQHFE